MTRVIYALGGVLVLVAAVFIPMGIPIVHLEQGWTEIIAGSVAGAAGCVIVVLGVFLSRMDALLDAVDRLAETGLRPGATVAESPSQPFEEVARPAPAAEVMMPAEQPAAEVEVVQPPEPVQIVAEDKPVDVPDRVDHAAAEPDEVESMVSEAPAIQPQDSTRVPAASTAPPEPRRPNFLAALLARRAAWPAVGVEQTEPTVEPVLTRLGAVSPPAGPPRTMIDLSSGWPDHETGTRPREVEEPETPHQPEEPVEVRPEPPLEGVHDAHEDDHRDEPAAEHHAAAAEEAPDPGPYGPPPSEVAPPPPREVAPPPPTVVGRYNAGSASYVMYSNGMIEVETETGVHQFASMQELKAFIGQQDAARV